MSSTLGDGTMIKQCQELIPMTPPPPPFFLFRPEGMVWDIQVQSLDHKSILPVLLSKASPSVTVDNLKPGG